MVAGMAGSLLSTGVVKAFATTGPAGHTVPLNQGWRFCGENVAGGAATAFDDSHFPEVTLPHTVVPLSWRNWVAADWQKVWLYRKHLAGPAPAGQRVFVDFDAATVSATVSVNGHAYPQHQGGYLPWSQEITAELTEPDNVLAVVLDSRWSAVPPEGAAAGAPAVDYLEPGGLYRDVALRHVPEVFLTDVFAKPVDVLGAGRRVDVQATIDAAATGSGTVTVALTDGGRTLATASAPVRITATGQSTVNLSLTGLSGVKLWAPGSPQLYQVTTTLRLDHGPSHSHQTRIGFRQVEFTENGFLLNGKPTKIFGLNRHQSFPYVGFAMPERAQRRDAEILVDELNCLMVRCSHYPQSPHFLDACDELGLMVWEEPPGWQYVGDAAWQDLAVADVRDMVLRDRNRPSVIVWGIRLNETANYPDLYQRTRQLADELDGSRPTSGAMDIYSTEDWAADVFAYDDYHTDGAGNATLNPPLPGVPYLVSESVGALDGAPYYRWIDTEQVLASQAVLHAQVHDIARSDERYAGLLGWAGIDYASYNGHIYDSVKWPGVLDTFRVPKFGAAFYQSQVDPAVRPVLAPAFFWDFGPTSPAGGPGPDTLIGTNCDRLEFFVDGTHLTTGLPATDRFPHLSHPPVLVDLTVTTGASLPELRIDGYVGNRRAISRTFAADPKGDRLSLVADDATITADGSDATRVVFRAVDAHGNQRPGVTGNVTFALTGPAVLVGDNPFAFGDFGGVGGVWLRSWPDRRGPVTLTARHPVLGSATVRITVT
jgi:beta-galactosidase